MDTSTRERLYQLESLLMDSGVRNAPDRVAQLLTDDFIEFGSSGRVFNKQQIIDAIRGEEPALRTISDFRALELGPDVALVTYRVLSDDGVSSLRSSIWQRDAERWRMRFHQGTRASPAAPPSSE